MHFEARVVDCTPPASPEQNRNPGNQKQKSVTSDFHGVRNTTPSLCDFTGSIFVQGENPVFLETGQPFTPGQDRARNHRKHALTLSN